MIEKARENAEKLGFNNVEFRQGDIDSMPVTSKVSTQTTISQKIIFCPAL